MVSPTPPRRRRRRAVMGGVVLSFSVCKFYSMYIAVRCRRASSRVLCTLLAAALCVASSAAPPSRDVDGDITPPFIADAKRFLSRSELCANRLECYMSDMTVTIPNYRPTTRAEDDDIDGGDDDDGGDDGGAGDADDDNMCAFFDTAAGRNLTNLPVLGHGLRKVVYKVRYRGKFMAMRTISGTKLCVQRGFWRRFSSPFVLRANALTRSLCHCSVCCTFTLRRGAVAESI